MSKNKEVGIIEVMPENASKEELEDALYKKELLDAVTMQDYTGKACDDIIQQAIKEIFEL